MSSPTIDTAVRTCPACGASGSGRFCSTCGASLGGTSCAGCDAALSAGARFCHRCGLAAGAPAAGRAATAASASAAAPDRVASVMPWAVAFVALLALAAMAAGRNFNASKGSAIDGSANALPQAALGEVPPGAPMAGGAGAAGAPGAAGGRPPSLANMTPREMADRLFDRVMRLSGEGKADSAGFFATMALQQYASMGALDLDQRYDMGRIAEVGGQAAVARAQADTILQENPTHLLGLVLATKAAAMRNDAAALADFRSRLLAADRSGERQRGLDEYQRHAVDIDAAVAAAKGTNPGTTP